MKRLPLNPEESQSNINNLTVTPPPHRRCFGSSDKITFIRYLKVKALQYTFTDNSRTRFPPSEIVRTALVWFSCGSLQP